MRIKNILILSLIGLIFISCNDILDRPSKTDTNDDTFWTSEEKVRMYATEFYTKFFVGYGYNYNTNYAALLGYTFNDDILHPGSQIEFERSVPNKKGSTSMDENNPTWQELYSGPTWNFAWIRKSNYMQDRINERMSNILSEEAKKHWIGIARFFRAMEYAGLATTFGDVPLFEHNFTDKDFDIIYKPRDKHDVVMESVYNDLVYAMENVRLNDGDQQVNRYIVAAFTSRLALFEGTWQKYYYKNDELAKKFLELSITAAQYIMDSGKYDITSDFKSLFGSYDLKSNKECILYRHYDDKYKVTHSVASNCTMNDPRAASPTLDLIKAFICIDGNTWENSDLTKADDFSLENLVKTRDPRFEATFWDKPTPKSKGSYLYVTKFIDRKGPEFIANGESPSFEYTGINNKNDYPVMRLSEVLLNYIEAKAELATLGGTAISQDDLNKTINKIRNRPLDEVAIAKGVQKTKPLELSNLPEDPRRDPLVSKLIWEIRRERRMEFAFEYSRIIDLRRWKKLDYMDTERNEDLLIGSWVNFPEELPGELSAKNVGIISVINKEGKRIEFKGNNNDEMVGFYYHLTNKHRLPVLNTPGLNPYLSPLGKNNIEEYTTKGYSIAQTEGWPSIN